MCDVNQSVCEDYGNYIVLPININLSSTFTNSPAVLIKVIDSFGCEAILIDDCISPPTPTPTNTVTPTQTTTQTPTNTKLPDIVASVAVFKEASESV